MYQNTQDNSIFQLFPYVSSDYNSDEAIKEIALNDYQSTAGNLFLYDGLTLNLDKIRLKKNYQCPVCSN